MSSSLLQIKVDSGLKEKLKRIALSKGLNISSYIRMNLIEAARRDDDLTIMKK